MSIPRPTSAVNGGGFARSAGAAAGRGVLLVVLALAIGVLLLARALDDDGSTQVEAGSGTATTAPADTATTVPPTETTAPPDTTPAVTHPPAPVKVLVLNGRAIQGIAGANNEVLLTQNFNTLSPDNTPQPVPATQVTYVDPAYAPDAASIASLLGIPPEAVVQADTGTALGIDTKGANVIVVLGTDNVGSVS
jgi:hypothetical protein